jgi:ATP-dependent helicase Lhr and Lhr-like helicase
MSVDRKSFFPGLRASHAIFGTGTITKIRTFGFKLEIRFDDGINRVVRSDEVNLIKPGKTIIVGRISHQQTVKPVLERQAEKCEEIVPDVKGERPIQVSKPVEQKAVLDDVESKNQIEPGTESTRNLLDKDAHIEKEATTYNKEIVSSVQIGVERAEADSTILSTAGIIEEEGKSSIDGSDNDGPVVTSLESDALELDVELRWATDEHSLDNDLIIESKKDERGIRKNYDFQSRRIIENLRMGIVPSDDGTGIFKLYFESFTVGRSSELATIKNRLLNGGGGSIYISGAYGTGKTHLLHCISYMALQNGYAVAFVEMDHEETSFSKPKSVYNKIMLSLRYIDHDGKYCDIQDLLSKCGANYNGKDYVESPYLHRILLRIKAKKVLDPEILEWFVGSGGKYPEITSTSGDGYSFLDTVFPPMYRDMTSANVYCNIISSVGHAIVNSENCKGLLLLFDESESLDTAFYTGHRERMGWNMVRALDMMSNNDTRLLHEKNGIDTNLGNYDGVYSNLRYSGHCPKIPYIFKEQGNIKSVFCITPVPQIENRDPFNKMPSIKLSHLNNDQLYEIFNNVNKLYLEAYKFRPYGIDHKNGTLKQLYGRGTRTLIKGSVELLDLLRYDVSDKKKNICTNQEMLRQQVLLKRTWVTFFARYGRLLPIQARSTPLILEKKNAILISATASGKTEAVVAPLMELLLSENWEPLSVLYISPTRALVNDLFNRLEGQLSQLDVGMSVKTGDKPNVNWNAMPDVLITTPESLDSIICRHPEVLENVRAIVLDEIHLLDSHHRGDQLRLLIRRLRKISKYKINGYALSATVSDPDGMASRYFDDYEKIVVEGSREMNHSIIGSLHEAFDIASKEKLMKILIFSNTRKGAERLADECKRLWDPKMVVVHHGSLSADERESVEEYMRTGKRGVCVSTMTLEIGIDIGNIDAVVLADVPWSISSMLQRIGRANRRTNVCRVMAIAPQENERKMMEMMFNNAKTGILEVHEYQPDMSVIVQQIFSMLYRPSGSSGAEVEHIRSIFEDYCDWDVVEKISDNLVKLDFIKKKEDKWYPTTALMDLGERGSIHSNIPDRHGVMVINDLNGDKVGEVYLPVDDTFILAGRGWRVKKLQNYKLFVTPDPHASTKTHFKPNNEKGAFEKYLPMEYTNNND